jgi:hypothetical protein
MVEVAHSATPRRRSSALSPRHDSTSANIASGRSVVIRADRGRPCPCRRRLKFNPLRSAECRQCQRDGPWNRPQARRSSAPAEAARPQRRSCQCRGASARRPRPLPRGAWRYPRQMPRGLRRPHPRRLFREWSASGARQSARRLRLELRTRDVMAWPSCCNEMKAAATVGARWESGGELALHAASTAAKSSSKLTLKIPSCRRRRSGGPSLSSCGAKTSRFAGLSRPLRSG